jgi:tRNA (guanine-N7-)-methyltransferase
MDRPIRSYVIRPGRMTTHQKRSLDSLSGRYCIDFATTAIDPAELFPECSRYVVEIGFGMGVATAEIARRFPGTGFLGIEVYRAGVGKLLSEIERLELDNLRIIPHDAVEVFETMISEESLDGIHIFFPDPWPKKRHHKRRLLQPELTKVLARSLKRDGYLYVVTDWEDYAEAILAVLDAEPLLGNRYEGYAQPQAWRPSTKFEAKGLSNDRPIRELYFTKV